MQRIRLKEGKQKKILNNYPWIFRDDIATHRKDRESIEDGSAVSVCDSQNNFIGVGIYNSRSHIPVRIYSRQNIPIDEDFFCNRIKKILEYRKAIKISSNAMRLVHGEADFIPGLMVDQYDRYLSVQFRTLGVDRFRAAITNILADLAKPDGIYERSDMESRQEEGLELSSGLLFGSVPEEIFIRENELQFIVDVKKGHKTGFYLDQRDNRSVVRSLIGRGEKGLDLFCYSGGFSVAMAASGAEVTGIDSDPQAVEAAARNARRNLIHAACRFDCRDVFSFLEQRPSLAEPQKYQVIVMDPPAIAKRKEGIPKLKWTYWKLLHDSIPMLRRGGYIVLSSCAYHMPVDLMLEAARFASADHGVRLRVERITYQPPDHPWILQIPETLYLKSLYLQLV